MEQARELTFPAYRNSATMWAGRLGECEAGELWQCLERRSLTESTFRMPNDTIWEPLSGGRLGKSPRPRVRPFFAGALHIGWRGSVQFSNTR